MDLVMGGPGGYGGGDCHWQCLTKDVKISAQKDENAPKC